MKTTKRNNFLNYLFDILVAIIIFTAVWFLSELFIVNEYQQWLREDLTDEVIETIPGKDYKEKYIHFQLNRKQYLNESNH